MSAMQALRVRTLAGSAQREVVAVARDGQIDHVSIAHTFMQRCIGLLGRRSLDTDAGLLIARGGSIHTCWMRFAIDVVFLSEQGEVLRVAAKVPPWRVVFAPRHTQVVLELCAGSAQALGIEPGEFIYLLRKDVPSLQFGVD